MIDTQTMRLDHPAEGVLQITLDRPERLNAQTPQMFVELEALAGRLNADEDLRAVILTGAGRAFCAGYDLDEAAKLRELPARRMYALQHSFGRATEAFRAVPQPIIAAVNGPAAGGGLSFALNADIRIASPEARFNAAVVRIGLSAGDLGASWHLPRIVGPGLAAEILYTGRFVEADEAERIGLVNRIVPAERLLDEALAIAAQIAANSPLGVELSKRVLQAGLDGLPLRPALEIENRGQALATRGEDMGEALSAFREKRPPTFTGR